MANKTKAQIAAENKALRAQLAAAQRLADNQAKLLGDQGNGKGKKGKTVWLNYTGYACQSPHTANYSSRKIVRHLRKDCGCDTTRGWYCKAAKPQKRGGYGMGHGTLGSDPSAHWQELASDAPGVAA
jgi:hypothetical protein